MHIHVQMYMYIYSKEEKNDFATYFPTALTTFTVKIIN